MRFGSQGRFLIGPGALRAVVPVWSLILQVCFCPPALAPAFDDVVVVEKAVQYSGKSGIVAEHFAPVLDGSGSPVTPQPLRKVISAFLGHRIMSSGTVAKTVDR